MNTPAEFVRKWQGHPYDLPVRNCWWFVRMAQKELFDRDVPEVPPGALEDRRSRLTSLYSHPDYALWVARPDPVHGAIVLMDRGVLFHAGIYLDGFGVLHTIDKAGVQFDSPLELSAARRWRLSYHLPSP